MIARKPRISLFFAFSAILIGTFFSLPAPGEEQEPSGIIRNRVYAKIILPIEDKKNGKQPVETWITKQLTKLGAPHVRAVTDWTPLPETGEDIAHIWDAVVADKQWGCPVIAHPVERMADGKIKIRLTGWAPVPLEQSGMSLQNEIGSRNIAVVDNGVAYVAILVVPVLPGKP